LPRTKGCLVQTNNIDLYIVKISEKASQDKKSSPK